MVVGSSVLLSGCNLNDAGNPAVGTATAISGARGETGPRSVTISWLPPDTNDNGSALTDLAGYRIHYGVNSTALTTQIDIPTSGLTDYVIENLILGATYYFAISAYNSEGVESNYSPVISVTAL